MAKRKQQKTNGQVIAQGLASNLKNQTVLARAAFETATVQKVGQAFFIGAASELIERHGWTAEQCSIFLTAVSQRTRALLLPEKEKQDGFTNLD